MAKPRLLQFATKVEFADGWHVCVHRYRPATKKELAETPNHPGYNMLVAVFKVQHETDADTAMAMLAVEPGATNIIP